MPSLTLSANKQTSAKGLWLLIRYVGNVANRSFDYTLSRQVMSCFRTIDLYSWWGRTAIGCIEKQVMRALLKINRSVHRRVDASSYRLILSYFTIATMKFFITSLSALAVIAPAVMAHPEPAMFDMNLKPLDSRSIGVGELMNTGYVFERDDGSKFIKRGGKWVAIYKILNK